MQVSPFLALLLVLVFIEASWFFALAETALFSLGTWRVQRLRAHGGPAGQIVSDLLRTPQDILATIVLGNSVANAGLVTMALWGAFHHGWPLWGSLLGACVVILFGCEALPKTLAVRAPEFWAARCARPLRVLHRLSLPLRRLAQALVTRVLHTAIPSGLKPIATDTDAEYRELLELAQQQGALQKGEKEIILQILSLDHRTARDVMRPRTRIACLSDDLSIEEMVAAARRWKHRRLPLHDAETDTIVGVLNTQRLLLDPHHDLAEAVEFPSFVPESMNLLQLLSSLQRQQRGLAVVLDEFGGTAGIVRMEDILEEIVGELRPEASSEGFVMERVQPGVWRVSGTMRLDDFRREYPDLGRAPGIETMGGLMLHELGIVPAQGQSVRFGALRLTAHVAEERRVRELLVELAPERAHAAGANTGRCG
jgi:CBS domain containing-hemolysin-like protein